METPRGHVLYVEDHDDMRILMTTLLERAGFRVTQAACGQDCPKLVEGGERFDLYLLNHTFPDASGVAVCEALRRLDAETPILFYSGRALPEEREAAMRAGAQGYLVKPDDLFNVAGHVASLIEKKR